MPNIDLTENINKEKEKSILIEEEILKPYYKTHVLLSFPPDKLLEISLLLEQIKNLEYVEYEQSSN